MEVSQSQVTESGGTMGDVHQHQGSSFPCATSKFYKVSELFSTGTRQTLKGDHAGEKTEVNRASNNQVIE